MESPCVDVCVMNPETGLCDGCGRTLDEICAWASLTPERRRAIMGELDARRLAAAGRS